MAVIADRVSRIIPNRPTGRFNDIRALTAAHLYARMLSYVLALFALPIVLAACILEDVPPVIGGRTAEGSNSGQSHLPDAGQARTDGGRDAGSIDAGGVDAGFPSCIEWSKTLDNGDNSDQATSARATPDNGFVIAGADNSVGSDALLIKTDSVGTLQWRRTYYGVDIDIPGEGHITGAFSANNVYPTNDDGFVLIGNEGVPASPPSSFPVLLRTDGNGEQQWAKSLGGGVIGEAVVQTNDGGFAVLMIETAYYGPTSGTSHNHLVKTDEVGNVSEEKPFGLEVYFKSFMRTSDGNLVFAGGENSRFSHGSSKAVLVGTSEAGDEQWRQFYEPVSFFGALQQTRDRGFIASGYAPQTESGRETLSYPRYLVKTFEDGTKQWSQVYPEFGSYPRIPVQQALDGGFVFAVRRANSETGERDVFLVKIDSDGVEEWRKAASPPDSSYNEAVAVFPAEDGGTVVVGNAHGRSLYMWISKVCPPLITAINNAGTGKVGKKYDNCTFI